MTSAIVPRLELSLNVSKQAQLRQAALEVGDARLGEPVVDGRGGVPAIRPVGDGARDGMRGAVGDRQVDSRDPARRVTGIRHRVIGGIGLGQDPVAGVVGRGGAVGGGHLGEAVVHVVGILGYAAEGVDGLLQAVQGVVGVRCGRIGVGIGRLHQVADGVDDLVGERAGGVDAGDTIAQVIYTTCAGIRSTTPVGLTPAGRDDIRCARRL